MDSVTTLALDAAAGSAKAREELVRACYAEVHRLCASLVSYDCADDLAQETFLRAVRGLGAFRGGSSARTWVLAIARRTCMDELRARHRRRRRDRTRTALGLDREVPAPGPEHAATVSDLLGRLSPERRAAFVLTQELGLTYEQAATVCECPVGTVRSRVARARADLIALVDADTQSSLAAQLGSPGPRQTA